MLVALHAVDVVAQPATLKLRQWKIATTCCHKIITIAKVMLQFDWLRATFSMMGLSNGAAVGSALHLHLGSGGIKDQLIAKLWQIDSVSIYQSI